MALLLDWITHEQFKKLQKDGWEAAIVGAKNTDMPLVAVEIGDMLPVLYVLEQRRTRAIDDQEGADDGEEKETG